MTPAKSHRGRGWGNKHSISVTRSVLVFCCTSVLVGVKFLPLQEGSLALVGTCLLGKWEDAIGGGRRGAVCSKLEGKCLVFEHASCKVLGDHSTSLPQNREIWVFSYYRVSWKMLEHFIATLKISLKLKAIQLPNILFLQR